jgi:stage V sporulation protein B
MIGEDWLKLDKTREDEGNKVLGKSKNKSKSLISKDSLIKGTLILAAAALLTRLLGILQRIPFDYFMSEDAQSYFNTANNIYLLLLGVATAGLPSAINKMVSERMALGRRHEANRIFRLALMFGLCSGFIFMVLLFFLAPWYAAVGGYPPEAATAVAAIAPTLFIFPIIAMIRGYFQGNQYMTPGAVSQIFEQIARVITAVGLMLLVLWLGWADRWVAGAVALGGTFGGITALAVLLLYLRRRKVAMQAQLAYQRAEAEAGDTELPVDTSRKLSVKQIFKEMFSNSLVIVVTGNVVQFLFMFDLWLFPALTSDFYGTTEALKAALAQLGTRAQPLAGIPAILAIALATSIIPIISSNFALRNYRIVKQQISLVLRIVIFTGVPIALALIVASQSVTGLLFSDTGGYGLVAALTVVTICQLLSSISSAILFALGRVMQSLMHAIVGILVQVLFSFLLAPLLGAYGFVIASVLCLLSIAATNLLSIRKVIPFTILGHRWTLYAVTIIVPSVAGYLVNWGMIGALDALPSKLTYFLAAAATGIVALVLYLLLILLLRVISIADIDEYPVKLQKIFRPLMHILHVDKR